MEQKPENNPVTEEKIVTAKAAKKYKWVAFLSKLALICNVCFLLCIVLAYTKDFITIQNIKGTIIILGLVASFIINIFLQATLLIFRVTKKDTGTSAWIRIFNVAAFAIQVIYYFFI